MTFRRFLPRVLVAGLLASVAHADGLDDAVRTIHARVVTQLDELGDWCKGQRLFREQHRLAEAILELDAEHAGARRLLRYTKKRKEGWVQSSSYRQPANRSEEAMSEYRERRQAVAASFARDVLEACDLYDAPRIVRERHMKTVLRIDPEQPDAREALGEVRAGANWILADSARALKRRLEFEAFAKKAVEEVQEPKLVEPNAQEKALKLAWKTACVTENARIVTTRTPAEVVQEARCVEASRTVFREAFGTKTKHREGYHLYVLGDSLERAELLESHAGISSESKEFLKRVDGGWMTGNEGGVWNSAEPSRIDGATRTTIAGFFYDEFHITVDHGWVFEGIGLYLSGITCGTRLNWFVQPSPYGKRRNIRDQLLAEDADWFREARMLVEDPECPQLENVLRRSVNSMTTDDLLVAFALGALLVESRPEGLANLMREVAKTRDPVPVVSKYFGMDMVQLKAYLLRFLRETAPKG